MSFARPASPATSEPSARAEAHSASKLGDLRFRALLSQEEWESLAACPCRSRFSKRLADGAHGRLCRQGSRDPHEPLRPAALAVLARLIGGPLPTSRDAGLQSVVAVTEDLASGGQIWTRLYARRKGFPADHPFGQTLCRADRPRGASRLRRRHGADVHAEHGALIFRSAVYYLRIGRWRFTLPRFLSPGKLTVGHAEMGDGSFLFTLDLAHPLLGELVHQRAIFEDTAS